MKYFVAITLLAAVASAAFIQPLPASEANVDVQEIIAAIQHPGTNPATAAALEQMLIEALGLENNPAAVGPAIITPVNPPIIGGPAIVTPELPPISVGPEVVGNPTAPVAPVSPVAVAEPALVPESVVSAPAKSPLVQIIINLKNSADVDTVEAPVLPGGVNEITPGVAIHPIAVVDQVPTPVPSPVTVVESAPTPVTVVEAAPSPVNVVDFVPTPVGVVEAAPSPVGVIEVAPVVEPVLVAHPVIVPGPAITLPEILN